LNSLPNPNVPDKNKDEAYHKQALISICGNALTSGYIANCSAIDENYKYYNNLQNSADKFRYLQESDTGETYPATWFSLNQIRSKLRVVVGELMQRGYNFNVKAINKEAKSRKIKAMEEMRVDMRLQPIAAQLSEYSGLPLAEQGPMPEDDEELEKFYDRDYRELAELIIYYSLKFLANRNYWNIERKAAFLDVLIAGKCIIKNEIVGGMPIARRVDPRDCFHDPHATDDLLRDATYWGERRYMSLADAAERYGLGLDELKNLAVNYDDWVKGRGQRNSLSFSFPQEYSGLDWFKSDGGSIRVLVLEACWQDTKDINQKVWIDKYGNEQRKPTRSQKSKEGDFEVQKKRVKVWRTATLIGGTILRRWGLVPNQQRDTSLERLQDVEPPYVGLTPDYTDNTVVSIVDQVKSLQNLKDIFAYNMQTVVSVAGVPGFVYDVAQAPKDWTPEQVVYYLKKTGIAFINSKQSGAPAQFNQFQRIDLSLSASISKYLELIAWCDNQIDLISGINDARQGVIQGASQAVGVTRAALLQSNMTTAPLFGLFDIFCSRVWNQQARLVKIAWKNKAKFAPIIGDIGFDFLKKDIDLVDDFAVFVEATPQLLDDVTTFQQLIMAGLSSGSISLLNALTLMREKDVTIGIEKLRKVIEEAEEKALAQQQAMMQQQEVIKAQNQQNMLRANQMSQQAALENQFKVQQLKGQQAVQQELLTQRGNLLEKTVENT
jgi:hypothetical protein